MYPAQHGYRTLDSETGGSLIHKSFARDAARSLIVIMRRLLLKNSLDGFSSAIETGGYLIYTDQPWHPQVELIARTLSSHRNGKPWVMRRRTQAEMDFLVEKAGFEKLDELIDVWGIFTVSIAKRV